MEKSIQFKVKRSKTKNEAKSILEMKRVMRARFSPQHASKSDKTREKHKELYSQKDMAGGIFSTILFWGKKFFFF